ncbi:hypothetical protein SNOG_09651 [Parastagonospora nodorum SN15]|uniref:Uncharacterized protein n=1 Tax=Phaeosphaeria nodorum (strain SN15 / ATCC MYA-4574 / FGSC 10173) TaxID=321614 RepID=Q0UF13_PHANO|nr:hypothetical protein SNOG_09651 [Parastagonospora nodorum SN15]EAT82916.1 hypothetical protein SNOG_09651 [Parastagonospora nodorum SN15]
MSSLSILLKSWQPTIHMGVCPPPRTNGFESLHM